MVSGQPCLTLFSLECSIAKILSLSIEKAKLEQTQLRTLIADLQETVNAQAAEATATPQR